MDQATTIQHQGREGQRLVVRFANQGMVTINTAIAPLVSKDAATSMSRAGTTTGSTGQGWLGGLSQGRSEHELHRLPEDMTDPFRSLGKRLTATLESFRFNNDARDPNRSRNLLDWAVAQTGLNDPLTKYTRQELEQAFPRFARDREQHLLQLVKQIKTQGQREALDEAARAVRLEPARQALQRAMRG